MPEATVNLKVDEAYAKLKAALVERGGVVVSEDQPKQLVVKQGSLWGISPRTAKKTITLTLEQTGDKATIKYGSKLASDWKNITITGCILAFILTVVCVWLAVDLGQFMVDGNPSFWSWIITSGDKVEFVAGEAFVNLAWGLAVFLSIVIALEAAIYVYAGRNIKVSAKDAIDSMN